MKKSLLIFFLITLVASFSVESQCAMCRAVLESEEGSQQQKELIMESFI